MEGAYVEFPNDDTAVICWPDGRRNAYQFPFKLADYVKEVLAGSDRVVAVVSGAYLDACLCNLLERFLVDDTHEVGRLLGTTHESESGLATYSSRARAAYCLGLIGRSEFDQLKSIARIRNHFAHHTSVSFGHPSIKKEVRSLTKRWEGSDLGQQLEQVIGTGAPLSDRNRFILVSRYLLRYLQIAVPAAESRRCRVLDAAGS